MDTISVNDPTGMEVERIENVSSVRDISWQNDSDHITITTDYQVHIITVHIYNNYVQYAFARYA